MEYPKYGCWTFFAPNSLADKYASKIKLVETTWQNKLAYLVKGLPCWRYSDSRMMDPYREPDLTMNMFDDKGCWSGWCTQHAIVHTAILQERTKGGWNIVDEMPLKAIMVGGKGHWTTEIYIKDVGYFWYDLFGEGLMYQWRKPTVTGLIMMNRHFCTGEYTEESRMGSVPYNSEWAGPPHELPKKSYIEATSSPSRAGIWLKKH